MNRAALPLFLFILALPAAARGEYLHHDLTVRVFPHEHRLEASDTVTLPGDLPAAGPHTVPFVLHDGLDPRSATEGVSLTPAVGGYEVTLPAGLRAFTVNYGGVIDHPLESVGEEYARGQKRTAGQIGPEGVYLGSSSQWHPRFDAEHFLFTLTVELPASWEAVSQGRRISHRSDETGSSVTWKADRPQEEIYLVAGPFTEYGRSAPGIDAMAFFRQPEERLADRYLDATVQYVNMYSKLVGPYPYGKFALVENFWETGYGMPSFTLLGPRVVRFPFILHSSYPHEILHNWWGNGVFIDYETGNWGEGLTAYLADHLVKEQRGQGADHRRTVLQKYTDYVIGSRDLPLSAFRGRHGSVSEAVGYGKTLMLFHMLRRRLGDDLFRRSLQDFYTGYRFRRASFVDLRLSFEKTSGKRLETFFDQWVEKPGAPLISLEKVERSEVEGSHLLRGAIVQSREGGPPFLLDLPVAVTVEGEKSAVVRDLSVDGARTPFEIALSSRPLRVDVDPEFDVFRRLHLEEVPPALTKAFGSDSAVILLPASADGAVKDMYRELSGSLARTGPGEVTVADDSDFPALPSDRSVWLLGWENRFLPEFLESLSDYDIHVGESGLRIGRTELPVKDHSFVLTARHRENPDVALLWIGSDNPAAMAGLGRKLPHYHKYSYLAFEGDEPANAAKGHWPVSDSPLTYIFPPSGKAEGPVTRGRLPGVRALAELEPLFSAKRMMETVTFLTDPRLEGRGLGSGGIEKSAEYISRSFESSGLLPAGDGGDSWFQTWTHKSEGGAGDRTIRNVVAFLPGTNPAFDGQSIVIGAHYDHLGMGNAPGGPDVRSGNEGRLHPGADDNSSGVAVLLEMARILGKSWKPERDVFFVAFTGEESGKIGSRRFVGGGEHFNIGGCRAMINLDTVGRLRDGRLLLLGGGSAREWVHIFRGAGYLAGVNVQMVAEDLDASDQNSFLEQGVPAVQLFTGPHLDYHRPGDLPGKIDGDGMVKVAAVAKEALEYLVSREEPLTASGASKSGNSGGSGGPSRKTSLGTVPDFTFDGAGVRLDGVVPGSPAERAGLLPGDIVLAVGEAGTKSLRELSAVLKSLSPGSRVTVKYRRDGDNRQVEVVLERR